MSDWDDDDNEGFELHLACFYQDIEKVKELAMCPGFSPNAIEPENDDLDPGAVGYTLLHRAVEGGNEEIIRFLLASGADPCHRDSDHRRKGPGERP